MPSQIVRSNGTAEAPTLPPDFAKADVEATDFCKQWDDGLDGNDLIAATRKLSQLALDIVAARLRYRERRQSEHPVV